MIIKSVSAEELALLINGLRSTHVADQAKLQERLLAQLEGELAARYAMVVSREKVTP